MNGTATILTYRVFYSQEGQLPGVNLDTNDIAWAMQRLPSDLEHRLPPDCSLSAISSNEDSVTFMIRGIAAPDDIERIVIESVDSFHLYATKL